MSSTQRVMEICKKADSDPENSYRDLARVFNEIFSELSGRHFGEPVRFSVSDKERAAQRFFYAQGVFGDLQIPFYEWRDVAQEAIRLVQVWFASDYKTFEEIPGYKEFWQLRNERMAELEQRKEYQDRFESLGSGN